ncbi:MAG: hypothetical protein HOO67_04685 [Candidatus Peribacteraceae bacterium]|nr:hypothetical protein [Candidatus Peribacteraceae bacterium]
MAITVSLKAGENADVPYGEIVIDGANLIELDPPGAKGDAVENFITHVRSLAYIPVQLVRRNGDVSWQEIEQPEVTSRLQDNQKIVLRVPNYVIRDSRLTRYVDALLE